MNSTPLDLVEHLFEETACGMWDSGLDPRPQLGLFRDGQYMALVTLRPFADRDDLAHAMAEACELCWSLDTDAVVFAIVAVVEVGGQVRDGLVLHQVTRYGTRTRMVDSEGRKSIEGAVVVDEVMAALHRMVEGGPARWCAADVSRFLTGRGHLIIVNQPKEGAADGES